ncbi:MAG: YwiC-like family protein [Bryobacteraceae bacterium]|nr:YwiC-like family protein [Bryobacteraceae bacterium]
MPKEHGSWGMFFLPLALGLIAAGQFSAHALLFVTSALLLFLAREPFLEAWRNIRRAQPISRKGRGGITLLAASVFAGVFLLPEYPALLGFGAIAAVVLTWQAEAAMTGGARTLTGELIAVSASMLNAPAAYYVATGRIDGRAGILYALALLYFTGTVFYVKMRVKTAHAKTPEAAASIRRYCISYHLFLLSAVVLLGATGRVGWATPAGYLPAITRALWYGFRPTRTLNLKQIGWTEVVYSLVWLAGNSIP